MTDLLIRHPLRYLSERAYILEVMCGEFLGLEFEMIPEVRDDICISFPDTDAELHIADVLFQTLDADWLQPQSLPGLPLEQWRLPEYIAGQVGIAADSVPVIYGRSSGSGCLIVRHNDTIDLGLDIFGSAFFMLTRYEEACSPELDEFGRFPASASLAKRAGFLERPIVNEYLEILRVCLQALRPSLVHRSHGYQFIVSHDVDRLFDTRGITWPTIAKNAIGDIVKRKDVTLAARRTYSKAISTNGDFQHEPSNTFNFIMDCSEDYCIRSAFNFIVHQGVDGFDGDYEINMPGVRALMRSIHARGHELGLHASYGSFSDAAQITAEFATLRSVAEEEGVSQSLWGGRQHYLRWMAGTTWQSWEDAGLDYDSTLTFPEAAGFRSGTCFEYPVFNLYSRTALQLRERPLIVMETSLFFERYMNLSVSDGLDAIARLSATCRRFGGSFTLLWHNDNLAGVRQKRAYRYALESAK
jgi:Family of unknown function (DUF7033)